MEEEYEQYEENTDIRRERRKDLVRNYLAIGRRSIRENPERVFREKQEFLSSIPERERRYILKEVDTIMRKQNRTIADIRYDFRNAIQRIPSSTYSQVKGMLLSLDRAMNDYVTGLIYQKGIENDFIGYTNQILDAINDHQNLQFNVNIGE